MSGPDARGEITPDAGARESLVRRAGHDLNRVSDSYGLVFLLIVATLLSTALVSDVRWGRALTALLMTTTLLLTFRASRVLPNHRGLVAGVAAALLGVAIVAVLTGDAAGNQMLALVIAAGFVVAASLAIVRRLRSQSAVTMPTVMGALCVYLFIGFFFAVVYTGVDLVEDAAFFAQVDAPGGVEFVSFSFITQATVGYGDLSPDTDFGRMLAVTQALLGQVYLVTIVAALVSNLGRVRPAESPASCDGEAEDRDPASRDGSA